MIYPIFFTDSGTPKTGLSPTIDIYIKTSDGTSAGSAPAVSEYSGGFYVFTATPTVNVLCRIDSNDAAMSDAERYKIVQLTPEDEIVNAFYERTPTAGGVITTQDILKQLHSMSSGNIVISNGGLTYAFYDDDGATLLFTFTLSSTGRTLN